MSRYQISLRGSKKRYILNYLICPPQGYKKKLIYASPFINKSPFSAIFSLVLEGQHISPSQTKIESISTAVTPPPTIFPTPSPTSEQE